MGPELRHFPVSFPVWLRVAPSYLSNQYNVNNLASGDSPLVSFSPAWIPALRGPHVTKCKCRPDRRQRDRQRYGFRAWLRCWCATSAVRRSSFLRDCRLRDEYYAGVVQVVNHADDGRRRAMPCAHAWSERVQGISTTAPRPGAEREPRTAGLRLVLGRQCQLAARRAIHGSLLNRVDTDLNRGNNSAPPRSVSLQVRDVGCSKIEYPYGSISIPGQVLRRRARCRTTGRRSKAAISWRMLVGTGPAYYYTQYRNRT